MAIKKSWKWRLAQKLEYKWWQRYLKQKDIDEYHVRKRGYWQKFLAVLSDYIPIPAGARVLDAGCGPAGIFMALENNQVDAIDPLLEKYQHLAHFQPEKFRWTSYRAMMLESLDETEKYDFIFCLNVINHVNDIALCCDKLLRALKPDGYLVISTDAHRFRLLKKLFQLIPGDMLHPVQMSIAEFETVYTRGNAFVQNRILYKKGGIFDYYITIIKKQA
jgi:2-polyprenyl-6-hydroxyphenyl methylase/3-demethylubiquinone-9 3-methyltransferase